MEVVTVLARSVSKWDFPCMDFSSCVGQFNERLDDRVDFHPTIHSNAVVLFGRSEVQIRRGLVYLSLGVQEILRAQTQPITPRRHHCDGRIQPWQVTSILYRYKAEVRFWGDRKSTRLNSSH